MAAQLAAGAVVSPCSRGFATHINFTLNFPAGVFL